MNAPTRQMTIDAKTTEEVLTHIQAINDLLPRLVTLTEESKEEMPDMGNHKNLSFTNTAINFAKANPELTAEILEIDAMESDWTSMKNLSFIRQHLSELLQKVSDTAALSGYEAYLSALLFYKLIEKLSHEGHNKALAIFDELHRHFPGRPKTVSSTLPEKTNLYPGDEIAEPNS